MLFFRNFSLSQFFTECPADCCVLPIEGRCVRKNYQLLATTALGTHIAAGWGACSAQKLRGASVLHQLPCGWLRSLYRRTLHQGKLSAAGDNRWRSSQRGATGRGTGPAGAVQSTGPPLQTVEEALRLYVCRLERVKGARLALRVTYCLPSCLHGGRQIFQLGRHQRIEDGN